MTILNNHDIKRLIKLYPGKYVIMHYPHKHGQTFIVERANPTVVVGIARRTILNDFNTLVISRPVVFYEFQDSEAFSHQRDEQLHVVDTELKHKF